MAKEEKILQDNIMLEFGSHPDIRLWRVNTGVAYGYSQTQALWSTANKLATMVAHGNTAAAAKSAQQIFNITSKMQPTKYGIKGTADINGIVSYQRPDGSYFARFIGIEVKSAKGKATPEQIAWGKMVEERGGIWILAFSIKDVRERLTKEGFDV